MKINGFRKPLNTYQVFAWIQIILVSVSFYTLIIPVQSSEVQVVTGTFASVFLLGCLVFGFICTYIDPTDPAVFESRKSLANLYEINESFDHKKYPKICQVCKSHVNKDSKHCRDCGRCVLHFDHHCKWLNNCIGLKNYTWFVLLITSLQGLVTSHCVSGIKLTLEVISNKDLDLVLFEGQTEWYLGLLSFFNLLSAVVAFFNLQLLAFHLFLKLKGMTTYEYIVMRRNKPKANQVADANSLDKSSKYEEVPLEEIFEPYIDNPNYGEAENSSDLSKETTNNRVPLTWPNLVPNLHFKPETN